MPEWGASHSGCSNAQSGDVALALIGKLDAEHLKAPAICTAQNPSGRGIAFSGGKCEGRQASKSGSGIE
jgi:hypothetical protein